MPFATDCLRNLSESVATLLARADQPTLLDVDRGRSELASRLNLVTSPRAQRISTRTECVEVWEKFNVRELTILIATLMTLSAIA